MLSRTDALGNVTKYTNDPAGNVLTQTDALGHVTTNTYDANSRKLSQAQTRTITGGTQTLVTSYAYDALGNLPRAPTGARRRRRTTWTAGARR